MIIKKTPNEYGSSNIELIDEEKTISIMQTGDDHTFVAKLRDYSHIIDMDFVVPQSEEELYLLFLNLYDRIVSGNVMGWDESDSHTQENMEIERSTSWYKQVVNNGVITIMSDAYPIAVPNYLTIRKLEGAISLEFRKVESDKEPKSKFSISINIRQSGSRIYDLAFPFKLLFRELQLVKETDIKLKKLDAKNI